MLGLSSWVRVGTALALALAPDSASAGLANGDKCGAEAGSSHTPLRLAGGGPDLPGLRTQRNQPAQGGACWGAPASTANAHAFTASWEELLRGPNSLGATSPAGFGVVDAGGAQDPFVDMEEEPVRVGAARAGSLEEEESEQDQAVEDDAMGYDVQERVAIEEDDQVENKIGGGGRSSGWTEEWLAPRDGGGGPPPFEFDGQKSVRRPDERGEQVGAGEAPLPSAEPPVESLVSERKQPVGVELDSDSAGLTVQTRFKRVFEGSDEEARKKPRQL